MRRSLILPLLLPLLLLLLAAPAEASRYRVGIGDQDVAMFTDKAFKPLGVKRVRYIVPWNWRREDHIRDAVTIYMRTAHEQRKEVLVHFTAAAGCWNGKRYSRARHCRAPNMYAYAASVRAFRRKFPWVRNFGAWNEANHSSQPTARSPQLAARYYNTLYGVCPRCRIVAADLLDSSNLVRYVQKFRRYARHKPRIWGLHNYSDVNRERSENTRAFLKAVPGQVWLTETGGLVRLSDTFPYSPARARARTSYMFGLADRLSRQRRGFRSRITRLYVYGWRGKYRGVRFDSGLVGPTGKPRPAYHVFRAKLRGRSR